ncbi:MAG: crossover junction endodeoxyribonuclease RuvC [Verrucomicrobiota bacterium]|jgi:crossover junction endodeoxyribonuclease RuvC|nr:crossover junction endodeoxyribonuclease RuvC [Verrucomicrobiota bacterium]
MKILGIDASLRGTGLAVIEVRGTRMTACHWEVVKLSAKAKHSECLRAIRERMDALLAAHAPDAAVVEGGFFFKNAKIAMILGEARGVVISACAAAAVPVFEYSPRTAKQNVTGWGAAPKEQVAKMVMSVLGLQEKPPADATDAMALALCHAQTNRVYFPIEPV